MTKVNKYIALLLAGTLLGGCSLADRFNPPKMDLPASFKEQPTEAKGRWKPAAPLAQEDRGTWWVVFNDKDLNALEMQALAANQSLKAAAARVEQSRAIARASTPDLLPNLSIGGNAARASGNTVAATRPYTLYAAQGTLSYEADLFGRLRDNNKALELDASAAAESYRSVLLALQADVAQNYFSLRTLDAERGLVRSMIRTHEEAVRIMQKRFKEGEAGELDLKQAESELNSTRAEYITLDRRRAALEHALAVLLGEMPSAFSFAEAPFAEMPPEIPAGLPSALLERRPDIASAQSTMAAANARIGAAKAAFFPSLTLTASGGYESSALGNLFQWSARNWMLGQVAGMALSLPIFDNGRRSASLDRTRAEYDEAIASYRQQVLVAFRDVEDNLSDQSLLRQRSAAAEDAATAAKRVASLTQTRYDEGEADYFDVVSARRTSLATARDAIQTRGQRFVTTVNLIRALGGGWE